MASISEFSDNQSESNADINFEIKYIPKRRQRKNVERDQIPKQHPLKTAEISIKHQRAQPHADSFDDDSKQNYPCRSQKRYTWPSTLVPGKFIVQRKRKNRSYARVRFILDPLYCKKCPGRLYECLKEAAKILDIQLDNTTKLIIIEFAALTHIKKGKSECFYCANSAGKECPFCHYISNPNTWKSACSRCHKGGCSKCYARRHQRCQRFVSGRRNTQRHKSERNLVGGFKSGKGAILSAILSKWELDYEYNQQRKNKHRSW